MAEAEALLLQDRIWNAFPVTQAAFGKLLSLLEVQVSREVATACVSLGARSRLRLNPDFAARHCGEDPALVMLVLHELFHVALGHTRLYDRTTPAMNFAFDAIINAQLCLLFPGPEWTKLFRDCYDAGADPWFLLRPPEGWRTPDPRWRPGALGALHRRLYSDQSLSCLDLFELLKDEPALGAPGPGTLLGGHGPESGEAVDPEVLAEIRDVVAQWPMDERRAGRDQGGPGRAFQVRPGLGRAAAGVLRAAMRTLAGQGGDGSGRPRAEASPTQAILPHRTGADRRASVLEACGGGTLLHLGEQARRTFRRGERVHVYLDVSGSMDRLIPPLYAALARLTPWLAPRLHLFSTTVRDLSFEELRRGRGVTTDGTDIAVVTAHMVAHGVRRALVVTDGMVGAVPAEHARELSRRRGRFAVALTAGGDPAFARALAARVWNLPDLNQETP